MGEAKKGRADVPPARGTRSAAEAKDAGAEKGARDRWTVGHDEFQVAAEQGGLFMTLVNADNISFVIFGADRADDAAAEWDQQRDC